MKYTAIFFGLAFAVTAGAASLARADDVVNSTYQSAAAPADNLSAQAATENQAIQDYNANIDPLTNVRISGPYDQEDAFKGRNGYPLPGWDVFSVDGQANQ